jgi:hypothetical protein
VGVEERFNLVTQDWDQCGSWGHYQASSESFVDLRKRRKLNYSGPIEILSLRHHKMGPTVDW